jgi:hypothetical protein
MSDSREVLTELSEALDQFVAVYPRVTGNIIIRTYQRKQGVTAVLECNEDGGMCDCVDWTQLAQCRAQWKALMNTHVTPITPKHSPKHHVLKHLKFFSPFNARDQVSRSYKITSKVIASYIYITPSQNTYCKLILCL